MYTHMQICIVISHTLESELGSNYTLAIVEAKQAIEPRVKREARWTGFCHTCTCIDSLVVVSMFQQSENIIIARM